MSKVHQFTYVLSNDESLYVYEEETPQDTTYAKGEYMLDDLNVLTQRDSEQTLESGTMQADQLGMEVEVTHGAHSGRHVQNIVLVGMGGSALAYEFLQSWIGHDIKIPVEVVKGYELPAYVGNDTLVVVSSCSGNTEEALEALEAAIQAQAMVSVVTGGGALAEKARDHTLTHIILPPIKIQPRMLTFIQLRCLLMLFDNFDILSAEPYLDEMTQTRTWLSESTRHWHKESVTEHNYAKQLALASSGKIAEFFGGNFSGSVAYKWKISWNENAKNLSYWNKYPEFNHNEFIGWSSHPVEKPFAIFDFVSSFEHERIRKRFDLSDKLLSGKRPKATEIILEGDTRLKQLAWGHLLADFTSIYLGILNNVDPGPVPLVTKLKQELSSAS